MRTRRAIRFPLAAALTVAGAATVLPGCSSNDTSLASLRSNPSSRMDTLGQSHDEIDNRLTITNDTNLRALNQDIGRLLLLNRPSRSNPQRMPY